MDFGLYAVYSLDRGEAMKKVEKYLSELNQAIEKLSDEELRALVNGSSVAKHVAHHYAFVETALLDSSGIERAVLTCPPTYQGLHSPAIELDGDEFAFAA